MCDLRELLKQRHFSSKFPLKTRGYTNKLINSTQFHTQYYTT